MTTTIYLGDCRAALRGMAAGSVHCVVTSPPYYGLRDYGVEGQLGLERVPDCLGWATGEPCGECYVCHLVEVFREVRRVLRDDGTLWLNLGDSYSGGVTSVPETLNNLVKGADIFFFDTLPVAITAQSVDVTLDDQRAKQGEFFTLLRPERIGVEDGDDDFHEVLDFLAPPRDAWHGRADSVLSGNCSAPHLVPKIFDCRSVVISDLDSNAKPKLAVLSATAAGARKHNDAPLPIEEAREPRAEGAIRWHTGWDTLAVAAGRKGVPDVNLVNQPVALRNGLLPFAGLLGDFRIAKASEQQAALKSVGGGFVLAITDVGHLRFSFSDGRIIPYSVLYAQASAITAMSQPKQEMGIPDSVKKALQADGWICRSTIIWAKPNPMPESVTDRPTKSHEYIFLLTKSARYFWDGEAVKEASTPEYSKNGRKRNPDKVNGIGFEIRGGLHLQGGQATRNARSVWTIATQPFPDAHFAVFPEALVEPCVLAGTPAGGCCPACGAPYRRVVSEPQPAAGRGNVERKVATEGERSRLNTHLGSSVPWSPTVAPTRGWEPTCQHEAGPTVAAVVLDVFGGSGTLALVAERLGRDAVLCELNPEYVALAARRIREGAPLLARVEIVTVKE